MTRERQTPRTEPLRPQPAKQRAIVLMDTTLRDGEQTPDLSFSCDEKRRIAAALLCEVGVDRVEIGSARVSAGELAAARAVSGWAARSGLLDRVEMLGFCDGDRSVDWIASAGVAHMNLLVKGSERHCRQQLGLELSGHLAAIARTLRAAERARVEVRGVYLEDWSRGVTESRAYVLELVRELEGLGVSRVYLTDTLGVLEPGAAARLVRRMCLAFPRLSFEFHGHDDYGLAAANCLAAARAGAAGLHVTVNGLGERAGNASLSAVVAGLRDHTRRVVAVDEGRLFELSRLVAAASGCAVAHNAPIVGAHVFTQTAGIHADGDAKGGLYGSRLRPERFGRERGYALGKLSGRASLQHHLRALGVALAPDALDALLAAVVAEGERKRRVRASDLLRLIRAGQLRAQGASSARPGEAGDSGRG